MDVKREVATVIRCVGRLEHQTILELRYLCFQSWDYIAVAVGYDKRWVHRLHGRALEEVDQIRHRE